MKQSMVATAAMQQFMRTLQATNMELRMQVTQALAANPALEELPPEQDEEMIDFSTQDSTAARQHDYLLDSLTEAPSLMAHLEEQIHQSALPAREETAALLLVQNLDERGYFIESPESIASRQNWSRNLLSKALHAVQDLDPAGVGALDLRHSLMLQLSREGEADSLAMQLLRDHWHELVQHRYANAAQALSVSEPAVTGAARRIAQLNPDPGSAFRRETAQAIIPDLLVTLQADGTPEVVLTHANIPRLALSAAYREMMAEQADKPEVRRYLSRCFSEGRELIKAIADRQQTILQVARAIVQHQRVFFTGSTATLQPLKMEQIADATGLHVSTISRAVNGKYLQCSRGIVELRQFFTTALPGGAAGAISPETVQSRIRALIAAEDSRHPLSDAALEQLLAKEGISVARRTIAKYRDLLRILPASQRRR